MLELLKVFPPIRHAVAYGSSILSKKPDPTRQLDFLFLVDDAKLWHQQNLAANPTHYSAKARRLGAERLAESAEKAAGFHYNPYVLLGEKVPLTQVCKYGVIDIHRAREDLEEWSTFYFAGRMQKPVLPLIVDQKLIPAFERNVTRALAVGVLTVPQTVDESELYVHISKLSFHGDPRPEEAGKIERMVAENLTEYQKLYTPAFQALKDCVDRENGVVERKDTGSLRQWVPKSICGDALGLCNMDLSDRRDFLFSALSKQNSVYIRRQYVHYLKTTNFRDIAAYSLRKVRKALFSS